MEPKDVDSMEIVEKETSLLSILNRDTIWNVLLFLKLKEIIYLSLLNKDWKNFIFSPDAPWIKFYWDYLKNMIHKGNFFRLPSYLRDVLKPKLDYCLSTTVYTFGCLESKTNIECYLPPKESVNYYWISEAIKTKVDQITCALEIKTKSNRKSSLVYNKKEYVTGTVGFWLVVLDDLMIDIDQDELINLFIGISEIIYQIKDKFLIDRLVAILDVFWMILGFFELSEKTNYRNRHEQVALAMFLLFKRDIGILWRNILVDGLRRKVYPYKLLETFAIDVRIVDMMVLYYSDELPVSYFFKSEVKKQMDESVKSYGKLDKSVFDDSEKNHYDLIAKHFNLEDFPPEWIEKMNIFVIVQNNKTKISFLKNVIKYHSMMRNVDTKLLFDLFIEQNQDLISSELIKALNQNTQEDVPFYLEEDNFSLPSIECSDIEDDEEAELSDS